MKMGGLKLNGTSYPFIIIHSASSVHSRLLSSPLLPSTFNFPIPANSVTLSSSSSSSSLFHAQPITHTPPTSSRTTIRSFASPISNGSVEEVLPTPLDSSSDPPPFFDGTTRLYISYRCPYAQRVWITRECKGLQDKIKLVPIDLQNRPAWYKEKVNPANKVPSLEHNSEVKVESLDLIKYIDNNFEGPNLSPSDPIKEKFAEELFSFTGSFNKAVASSFTEEGVNDETRAAFDYLETALGKFDDGPFLLGQFSLVDIAYAPFIERYKAFLLDMKNYDIVSGRPRLATWVEQMDRIPGNKRTQRDPKEHVEAYKKRYLAKP